ncbi:formyltransferase family protein [Kitasatospora sp. NPDC097643]|uniref:formyltransferase family protein n=1 Tax=Kitasatospora sp. NPDC097643 TaxID=3157230 RepID=UPI00332233CE
MSDTSPVRIGFFGKPEEPLSLRGLEFLRRTAEFEIVFVTTGRGRGSTTGTGTLQRHARAHGLRLLDYPDVEDRLSEVDLVLSFSNSVVFPASFLNKARLGVVNMHPAALPAYRGSHGLAHAILNGETRAGVTLHYCAEKIDAGPVIDLQYIPIGPDDSVRSMWGKIDDLAHAMLVELAPRLAEAARRGERLPTVPQEPTEARWYSTRSLPDEWEFDPDLPPELQRRYVRAFDYPGRRPAHLRAGGSYVHLTVRGGEIVISGVTPADDNGGTA